MRVDWMNRNLTEVEAHLYKMCDNPLVFSRALEYWLSRRALVAPQFENDGLWKRLLRGSDQIDGPWPEQKPTWRV